MADFLPAYRKTIANEGGDSNHPQDRGGLTRFGISERTLRALGYAIAVSDITPAFAEQFYRLHFWDEYRYGELHEQAIAEQIFDACVNMGPRHAHECAQRAIRACNVRLKDDGVLGPATRAALNSVPLHCWLAAFESETAGYYRLIAALDPSQRVFLEGWMGHRAYDDAA